MPQDPERAPLLRLVSPQGQEQNGESSPGRLRSPAGVERIVMFVRGEGEPSWLRSFSWLIFVTYFNVFLAFLPLSFIAQNKNWDVLYRFGFSFLAIVPLAKVCAVQVLTVDLYSDQLPH
jgi:Ca2+:H+ antiporter